MIAACAHCVCIVRVCIYHVSGLVNVLNIKPLCQVAYYVYYIKQVVWYMY